MKTGSGSLEGSFSAGSRFEDGEGTNPEEILGAAHAGCYSMALSHILGENDFEPKSVQTTARVNIKQVEGGFEIDKIALESTASIPDIDEDKFQELAEMAKNECPVSKALAGPQISLDATLSG